MLPTSFPAPFFIHTHHHRAISHLPHTTIYSLPYLERCIKETLRLYPVAINLSRVAIRDTSLGGFRINKGAVVSVRHVKECYVWDG